MRTLTVVGLAAALGALPLHAKTIDVCFSPYGHCDQVFVSWIRSAEKSLDGAIYSLTEPKIINAFIDAQKRGVRVRLVKDRSQKGNDRDRQSVEALRKGGVTLKIQRGSKGGLQHNKFLIVDGKYVITGSFNWTRSAARRNDENFVVIDDQTAKFQREFDRLIKQTY